MVARAAPACQVRWMCEVPAADKGSLTAVAGVEEGEKKVERAAGPFVPRTVQARKEGMKGSPIKLNELARLVRGLSVPEAKIQMEFSKRRCAELRSEKACVSMVSGPLLYLRCSPCAVPTRPLLDLLCGGHAVGAPQQ